MACVGWFGVSGPLGLLRSFGLTGFASVPPPFSPADISGLALWLDADDAGTLTAVGGAVSEWRDKSGNARHFTATAAQEPSSTAATLNGRTVVRFDGVADRMTRASFLHALDQHTLFVVARSRVSAGAAAQNILTEGNTGTNTQFRIHVGKAETGDTTRLSGYYRDNAASERYLVNYDDVQQYDGDPHILTITDSGTLLTPRLDGVATATPTTYSRTTTTLNVITLGALTRSGVGGHYDGDIAELLAYNSVLTSGQIASVESFLGTRWGVVL